MIRICSFVQNCSNFSNELLLTVLFCGTFTWECGCCDKFYWVVCQEMDRVSSVLYCAVSGTRLKSVSSFQMSLWAVYRLGGPAFEKL